MRVLLVHGMCRTPLSLGRLTGFLQRNGHQPERVGYLAAVERFERIRARVRRRLEVLARSGEPYAVIGHSLGGLALRAAMIDLDPAPAHLVMLATPNRPPRMARRLHRLWPYRIVCGDCGQLLARQEFFVDLPPITIPYTIIAGSAGPCGPRSPFGNDENDWIVTVDETRVTQADRPATFPVAHTFMMNDHRVQEAIKRALAQPT